MIKPAVVLPGEAVTVVGRVFGTPVVVKGRTWLPLAEFLTWLVMAWVAKRRVPERSWLHCLGIGAVTMPVVLGSEWGHNVAHAAAARMVNKPIDAIRVTWGMPLLVYFDINDKTVMPKQHILRSLGGPVFNFLLLPLALLLKKTAHPKSMTCDLAEAAVGMNAFILAGGLQPIPGLDGGPILKWSLVERGQSIEEADRTVRKVNGVWALITALAGAAAFRKRNWLAGSLLVQFAAIAFSIATGLFKEGRS